MEMLGSKLGNIRPTVHADSKGELSAKLMLPEGGSISKTARQGQTTTLIDRRRTNRFTERTLALLRMATDPETAVPIYSFGNYEATARSDAS
ncbi:hypothetical protein GFL85_13865 [Rhizobium laguerreae]|uniref:hypothetical protein n=1 Tax=Rhizobium laguerreae TaxID=1076926 RepID=UPI00143F582B|nr:hypothetical protein [Rhizobium laguerreae]NKM12106.1 hypothetical protein [Rhizobium laguerreae]